MQTKDTKLYGKVFFPDTIAELSHLLQNVRHTFHEATGWRGQANIDWPMDSGLVRKITQGRSKAMDQKKVEKLARAFEDHLLNETKTMGLSFSHGRHLSDLEIMGMLQHHGAATRLLDFTYNAFIALWFACEDANQSAQDGVIFVLDLQTRDDDNQRFRQITNANDINAPYAKVLGIGLGPDAGKPGKTGASAGEYMDDWPLAWQPTYLFQRMSAQMSFFVFGSMIMKPWGSLPLLYDPAKKLPKDWEDEDSLDVYGDSDFLPIGISPSLKQQMNANWQSMFGFSMKTIFPDVAGFSQFHSANRPLEAHYYK